MFSHFSCENESFFVSANCVTSEKASKSCKLWECGVDWLLNSFFTQILDNQIFEKSVTWVWILCPPNILILLLKYSPLQITSHTSLIASNCKNNFYTLLHCLSKLFELETTHFVFKSKNLFRKFSYLNATDFTIVKRKSYKTMTHFCLHTN